MNKNDIYFSKIHPDAVIPTKRDEDAGYDIYPNFEFSCIMIMPLDTFPVRTGIACAMDKSKYLKLEERSSLAKKGIKISAGIIDSGYRGEIIVLLYNTNMDKTVLIEKTETNISESDPSIITLPYNSSICQGIVCESIQMNVKEIPYDELLAIDSERKTGGFGSTSM